MAIKIRVFNRDGGVFHLARNFVKRQDGSFDVGMDVVQKNLAGAVVDFGGLDHAALCQRVKTRDGHGGENPGDDDQRQSAPDQNPCHMSEILPDFLDLW